MLVKDKLLFLIDDFEAALHQHPPISQQSTHGYIQALQDLRTALSRLADNATWRQAENAISLELSDHQDDMFQTGYRMPITRLREYVIAKLSTRSESQMAM